MNKPIEILWVPDCYGKRRCPIGFLRHNEFFIRYYNNGLNWDVYSFNLN